MENEILSDDHGEQRRTDLDVPLLTPDSFTTVVSMFLNDVASVQWMLLATGRVDSDTFILLSDMCKEIVNAITVSVVEAVEPQVTQGGASSTSTTWTETQPKRQCHVYGVTEEAIQGNLGDSFHRCFGEALGVAQERTHESEELMKLIGNEVMKKVNHKLALMVAPTSSQQTEESEASAASHIEEMVHLIVDILRRCKKHPTWLDSDESEWYCPDEVTPVVSLRAEGPELRQSSDLAGCVGEDCSASTTEELQPDDTFLTVFLWRLLDHIATETRTLIGVYFYEMLARLTQRTEEELTSALPQFATNIHICIYEELCQEFGSAEELLSALVFRPVAFEEAVARKLKAKQKKSKKTVSFVKKLRRFFRKKTHNVTQACEKNTNEVTNQESGSTAEPQKKKRIRILSSIENNLRKTFLSYSHAFQEPISIPVFRC